MTAPDDGADLQTLSTGYSILKQDTFSMALVLDTAVRGQMVGGNPLQDVFHRASHTADHYSLTSAYSAFQTETDDSPSDGADIHTLSTWYSLLEQFMLFIVLVLDTAVRGRMIDGNPLRDFCFCLFTLSITEVYNRICFQH